MPGEAAHNFNIKTFSHQRTITYIFSSIYCQTLFFKSNSKCKNKDQTKGPNYWDKVTIFCQLKKTLGKCDKSRKSIVLPAKTKFWLSLKMQIDGLIMWFFELLSSWLGNEKFKRSGSLSWRLLIDGQGRGIGLANFKLSRHCPNFQLPSVANNFSDFSILFSYLLISFIECWWIITFLGFVKLDYFWKNGRFNGGKVVG